MVFTGDDDDADEWSAFGVPAVTSNSNALVAPASSLLSGRGEDEDWGGFMAPATSLPSVALPEPPVRMSRLGDFGDFGSFDIKGDDFADFADFESAPIALPLRTGSSVDCPDRF